MNVHIENRDILAHRIVKQMERCGMSQDLLAAKAGVSQSLISKILSEKRGAIRSSTLIQIAQALGTEVNDLVDLGGTMSNRSQKTKSDSAISQLERFAKPAKVAVNAALGHIEHWMSQSIVGIPTGFHDLDRLLMGLENGKLIALLGRPSLGKTSFALSIINNVAVDRQLPVGMFSLDMTAESAVLRLLCMRASVTIRRLREGFLAERDFPKLTEAAGKIATSQLYIDDSAGLTVDDIVARARRMKAEYGIGLLVIDYLQLIRATSRRAELNREVTVSDISISLKALAKELMIPIVILCGLPTSSEYQKRAKPSDSLDSSVLSQDADIVLILERNQDDEDWDDAMQSAVGVNVVVWKNREGPTGSTFIIFNPNLGRFENASKVTEDDIPYDSEDNPGKV